MVANPNTVSEIQMQWFSINLLDKPLEETLHEGHLRIHRVPQDQVLLMAKVRMSTASKATYLDRCWIIWTIWIHSMFQ